MCYHGYHQVYRLCIAKTLLCVDRETNQRISLLLGHLSGPINCANMDPRCLILPSVIVLLMQLIFSIPSKTSFRTLNFMEHQILFVVGHFNIIKTFRTVLK